MSEICREPRKLMIDGEEYDAFGDEHTLSDIIRYLLVHSDREEIAYLVGSVK